MIIDVKIELRRKIKKIDRGGGVHRSYNGMMVKYE